jgi:signal transduction histidine kinase
VLLYLIEQWWAHWSVFHDLFPFTHEIILNSLLFVALLLVPLSIGIAILRSQLWNIDLLIHRTLVYGMLSACVVGGYILLVGGLGMLLQQQGNILISLLATGVIAVLFHPLRERFQRGVSKLVYGERHDPYQVLSGLSQRLVTTLAPQTALSTIVETVAQAFQLPYVAIFLKQGDVVIPGAVYGQVQQETLLHLPLTYQGESLGELLLSEHMGETFSRKDQSLLEDLARHAGVVVHAARLSVDIQRSREQLVMTREEERRRLRRDLHDGLGPQLASQMLLLSTVRKLLHSNPVAAEKVLAEAMTYMQEAIRDIRRLVYDLRPPTLDDLGLRAALEETIRRYDGSNIIFTLIAPDLFPLLPAAVEVACYRIAQEALTNVINHANAQHCLLRLTIDNVLELEVTDDGQGLSSGYRNGIGLTSMRERVQELGGRWSIERLTEGGTRVTACFPLSDSGSLFQEKESRHGTHSHFDR